MNIRLSIGANLGRRAATLREAIRRLAGLPGTRLLAASSFYETAPWGKTDQPPFLNGAVELETALAPETLLHETQAIEQALGRVRHEHWGARTIDIDLVYATEEDGVAAAADANGTNEATRIVRRNTPELRLPHPYLLERAFVLEPLHEIEPGLILEGRPIASWCEKNAGQGVKKSDELAAPWPLQSIACVSADRGLGKDGKLLFRIPEDMAFFKQQTKTEGSVVIMGRKTWESLGRKPLAGRTNVVVSSSMKAPLFEGGRAAIAAGGVVGNTGRTSGTAHLEYASNLSQLSVLLEHLHCERPHRPFWLLGGGMLYRQLLPYTRRILLTEVAATPPADTFFPPLDGFACIKKSPAKTPGVMFAEYLRK